MSEYIKYCKYEYLIILKMFNIISSALHFLPYSLLFFEREFPLHPHPCAVLMFELLHTSTGPSKCCSLFVLLEMLMSQEE